MLTGRHMVRDVMCKNCKTKLGWMYEYATEDSQKWVENATASVCWFTHHFLIFSGIRRVAWFWNKHWSTNQKVLLIHIPPRQRQTTDTTTWITTKNECHSTHSYTLICIYRIRVFLSIMGDAIIYFFSFIFNSLFLFYMIKTWKIYFHKFNTCVFISAIWRT